ncbi:MAG: MlaD family protein [Mycobacteriaceae bacterium]
MSIRVFFTMVILASCVACGINPASLSLPGSYTSEGDYTLRAEFLSSLNLPEKAKVIAQTQTIGYVDKVELAQDHVVITMKLTSLEGIYSNSRAEIRQSSAFGETYVSILPSDSCCMHAELANGSTLPLSNTQSSRSVESQLRDLSTLINGGPWQKLAQNTEEINQAFPENISDLVEKRVVLTDSLASLAAGRESIARILDSMENGTSTLYANRDLANRYLAEAPEKLPRFGFFTRNQIIGLVQLGDVAKMLTPVVNRSLPVLNTATEVVEPVYRVLTGTQVTIPEFVDRLRRILVERLTNFFSSEQLNFDITLSSSQSTSEPRVKAEQSVQLLSAMGITK